MGNGGSSCDPPSGYLKFPNQAGPDPSARLQKIPFQPLGCYQDRPARAIEHDAGPAVSLENCAASAKSAGSTIFSVQNADPNTELGHCFHGVSKEKAKQYGVGTNCISSKNNYNQLGGYWSNFIYELLPEDSAVIKSWVADGWSPEVAQIKTVQNACDLADACNRRGEECKGFDDQGFLWGNVLDMKSTSTPGAVLYARWNTPLNPTIPAGGGSGGLQGRMKCDPGELMVGMKLRSGQYADGIESIQCQSSAKLNSDELPRDVVVNWAGRGGAPQIFQCPKGQAVKGYNVRSGAWMDGFQLVCKPVGNDQESTPSTISPIFGSGPVEQLRRCPTNKFLNGLTAWGGSYLDRLQGECLDTKEFSDTVNNVSRQLGCCAGTMTDSFACGPWTPASALCLDTKRKFCVKREHFFSEPCKQLFAPEGARQQVTSQSDDDIARRICAEVKKDPEATAEEKAWCACYNAEIPSDIPAAVRGLFQCIDPNCTSQGLKPYGMKCPQSIVVCTQQDIRTNLEKSDIGRQYIANECGSINVQAPQPPPPPPLSGPSAPTGLPSSGSGTASTATVNPWLIGGLAFGGVILLIILVVIGQILSKLGRLQK